MTGVKLSKCTEKSKKKAGSRSVLCGLVFPVGVTHRRLKRIMTRRRRVSATAVIYFAAVLEYLIAEVLDLAGNLIRVNEKVITPRHLQLAIQGDEDLDTLIKAIIPEGGVIPCIHKSLLEKRARIFLTGTIKF